MLVFLGPRVHIVQPLLRTLFRGSTHEGPLFVCPDKIEDVHGRSRLGHSGRQCGVQPPCDQRSVRLRHSGRRSALHQRHGRLRRDGDLLHLRLRALARIRRSLLFLFFPRLWQRGEDGPWRFRRSPGHLFSMSITGSFAQRAVTPLSFLAFSSLIRSGSPFSPNVPLVPCWGSEWAAQEPSASPPPPPNKWNWERGWPLGFYLWCDCPFFRGN